MFFEPKPYYFLLRIIFVDRINFAGFNENFPVTAFSSSKTNCRFKKRINVSCICNLFSLCVCVWSQNIFGRSVVWKQFIFRDNIIAINLTQYKPTLGCKTLIILWQIREYRKSVRNIVHRHITSIKQSGDTQMFLGQRECQL